MDIEIYDNIMDCVKHYFNSLNLPKNIKPDILEFEPSNPKYPIIIINEIRNIPNESFNNQFETVANLGYKVDIYAKTNILTKQQIARKLAKYCDECFTYLGLKQVSWNIFNQEGNNGELCHIITMYNANYFEQRKMIL